MSDFPSALQMVFEPSSCEPVERPIQSSTILNLINSQLGIQCTDLVYEPRDTPKTQQVAFAHDISNSDLTGHLPSHNLSGNPLELHELVDLSMESKLITNTQKEPTCVSKFSDFSAMKPCTRQPLNGYQDGLLYYISEDQHQLFGVLPLSKTGKRILRVKLETNPNIHDTIKSVQQMHMSLFQTFQCGFEAIYDFPCATFKVKYDTCGTDLLSPPPLYIAGSLDIDVDVYSCDWLSPLLSDIKILKNMYNAYTNDCFTWDVHGGGFTLDSFQNSLSDVFRASALIPIDFQSEALQCANLWAVVAKRSLDSTELLWNAIKGAHTRQDCRRSLGCAMTYLLENRQLLKLHRNNNTELATQLRSLTSRIGSVDVESQRITPVGVEYVLEIGLNKVLNDCLCLLQCVVPGWTAPPTDQKKIWDMEHHWAQLHHLYKCSCLLMVLSSYSSKEAFIPQFRRILNLPDPDDEWRTAIFGSASVTSLVIHHSFDLPVSELLVPISSMSPSVWIMRLNADRPSKAHVCLLYERIHSEGSDKYFCYVMRLIDSYVPPATSD